MAQIPRSQNGSYTTLRGPNAPHELRLLCQPACSVHCFFQLYSGYVELLEPYLRLVQLPIIHHALLPQGPQRPHYRRISVCILATPRCDYLDNRHEYLYVTTYPNRRC
jgi:hypothetical protein